MAHLYWPLRDLAMHQGVDLQLIVMGSHLSPEFGNTVNVKETKLPVSSRSNFRLLQCLLRTIRSRLRTIHCAKLTRCSLRFRRQQAALN